MESNMKILVIANYVVFPWEGGNSRFTYILNNLDSEKHDIELITSNFRHSTKEHRNFTTKELSSVNYKVTLLAEPGYKKNVSLTRFYSHYKLSKNLKRYLNKTKEKPNVIYCATPSLALAKVAVKYAKKNNIRFIVDIQDLWPEAFKMVFNIPIISDLIFSPMTKTANYIYKNADNVVAVSETYVNRALQAGNKSPNNLAVYLGTDLKYFDTCKKAAVPPTDSSVIKLVYIGTLGHSYDIYSVIDAIKILNDKGYTNLEFIIMGDGPLKKSFEEYAQKNQVNCQFTGRLSYDKMVANLCSCDLAVNPIIGTSAASIINKVGDYAASALPVINTQECIEYQKLLEDYHAGINALNNNPIDLANKIEILINNKELRTEMGNNNRKLAEKKFNRKTTYQKIINIIEKGS